MPALTAGEIASLVDGELVGEAGLLLASGNTLDGADESQLAFWERRTGEKNLPPTCAGCVIVDPESEADGRTLIRCRQPHGFDDLRRPTNAPPGGRAGL